MHMDIGKESLQQTIINLNDIPDSSPTGVQSLPSTPIKERQQYLQVSTSTNVTREKEETIFDTSREIKIINEMLKRVLILNSRSKVKLLKADSSQHLIQKNEKHICNSWKH